MNQTKLKDDIAQIKMTTVPDEGPSKSDSRWQESEKNGKMIPASKDGDKLKEKNCPLLDKENADTINVDRLNVHPPFIPNATIYERRMLPKLVGQEKPNSTSFPTVVVDSKAVNVLSNVKMSERNFKIELAPTFNQTGIIRPIAKLPLQSSSSGAVPQFSQMAAQFSHPPGPQINNMQQFQTFTNNQFQPIVRAEAGMNPARKHVNFVPATAMFNHHQILPPMPNAHHLAQNDTFTTNTHYDPVMIPSPLLIGIPGMTGHASHHISRPIPHMAGAGQHWPGHHNMALPPMIQQIPLQNRMAHFPANYPAVLPNIGVNRNEYFLKMQERLPKIQPDMAFHPAYNNLTNMQMKFAGRKLNDEAHMATFKMESNQFRNELSSDRRATNKSSREMPIYTPANSTNYSRGGEKSAKHTTCAQATDSKTYNPSKLINGVTLQEHVVSEQGIANKNDNMVNPDADKKTAELHGDNATFEPEVNVKQTFKVPTFNRTVRELISVPFTSDESRLVYLLKKRHQGHPIAQEWLFICNGLLTSHFRKLWHPPCNDEDIYHEVEEVSRHHNNRHITDEDHELNYIISLFFSKGKSRLCVQQRTRHSQMLCLLQAVLWSSSLPL